MTLAAPTTLVGSPRLLTWYRGDAWRPGTSQVHVEAEIGALVVVVASPGEREAFPVYGGKTNDESVKETAKVAVASARSELRLSVVAQPALR